jgi:hypothetical protein
MPVWSWGMIIARYKYDPEYFNDKVLFSHRLVEAKESFFGKQAYFENDQGCVPKNQIIAIRITSSSWEYRNAAE